MNTKQQNQVAMYGTVLSFLNEAGAPLTKVKRIGEARTELAGLLARIETTEQAQDHTTTGITKDRKQLKAEVAQKAEILRLLVVMLSDDPALRGELKLPLSRVVVGKDSELLTYVRKVDAAVDQLPAAALADAGYDPEVRADVQAGLKTLTETQNAARLVETSTTTATRTLPELLTAVTELLEDTLDPLVQVQQLLQPELVAQYEAARRVMKTAARRGTEYRGTAQYNVPTLIYDRRIAGLSQPTLGNRSGKGLTLRYYTAATPTAAPAPGQGVVVKNNAPVVLDDYSRLGEEGAPYLLVLLEQLDGEGKWVVR